MKKRGLAWCLLVLCLINGAAFADASEVITYYPLTQFINRAVEVDPTTKTLEAELEILEEELKKLEKDNKDRSKIHNDADAYVAIYMDLEYKPKAKAVAIEQAKRKIAYRSKEVAWEATKKYYSLKNAQLDVTEQKKAYDKAVADYQLKEKAFEKGYITAAVLKNYEIARESEALALERAERALSLEQMTINAYLDQTIDKEMQLPSLVNTDIPLESFKVDMALIEQTEAVTAAKEAYDLAVYKLDVYDRHMYNSKPQLSEKARYYESPTGYYDVKKAVADAEEAYEKTKRTAYIDALVDRNACLNARSQVRIETLKFEKAEMDYEAAKVRHGLGLVTDAERDDAYYAYKQALYAKRDAERALYYQWHAFKGNFL